LAYNTAYHILRLWAASRLCLRTASARQGPRWWRRSGLRKRLRPRGRGSGPCPAGLGVGEIVRIDWNSALAWSSRCPPSGVLASRLAWPVSRGGWPSRRLILAAA